MYEGHVNGAVWLDIGNLYHPRVTQIVFNSSKLDDQDKMNSLSLCYHSTILAHKF